MITTREAKVSHVSHLQCSQCHREYGIDEVNTTASCEVCVKSPLLTHYAFLSTLDKADIDQQERSMWRYFPVLPVKDRRHIVSLGEGFTPLIPLFRLAAQFNLESVVLKDESFNPTGSFKARGLSMAISKAKELGIQRCIVPTAGNAGGAMAAYCAKAGMDALVVMPEHTPPMFVTECEMFGAEVVLVKGLISDCAAHVREINSRGEYFDLSTLKEPYRLEGKKTMGYEIAEQLNWELPDVILYPTGGGTGLIGMWKAFNEMIDMGWIENKRPRMIAVQAENCRPIVETWLGHQPNASAYKGVATYANGLAVPNPFAEALILQVLRESGGEPMAVSEEEIVRSQKRLAKLEGIFAAPEGAALVAALGILSRKNTISPKDRILLLNTGAGYKYM